MLAEKPVPFMFAGRRTPSGYPNSSASQSSDSGQGEARLKNQVGFYLYPHPESEEVLMPVLKPDKILEVDPYGEADRIVQKALSGEDPFEAKVDIYDIMIRAQLYYYMYVLAQARISVLDDMLEAGTLKATIRNPREWIERHEAERARSSLLECGWHGAKASHP